MFEGENNLYEEDILGTQEADMLDETMEDDIPDYDSDLEVEDV